MVTLVMAEQTWHQILVWHKFMYIVKLFIFGCSAGLHLGEEISPRWVISPQKNSSAPLSVKGMGANTHYERMMPEFIWHVPREKTDVYSCFFRLTGAVLIVPNILDATLSGRTFP